jgi:histidine ammonia-lyase
VSEVVMLAPPEEVRIEDVGRVAAGAPVALADGVLARMRASQDALAGAMAAGRLVYGLTTGCGPLCDRPIADATRVAFQRNLVRSHAAGLGASHPEPVVRATMTARATSLAQARSGVRPILVETLVAMLNAGVHPVVPEVGSVGASGDLVELAHVALGMMGEGEVGWRGRRLPAAEALRAAEIAPIRYEGREGLAMMNGTSCEVGQAALAVLATEAVIEAAEAAAALVTDVLRGSPESFDPRLHAARRHPGQEAVAARLRERLAGSARARPTAARRLDGEQIQDAYTVRCTPQIVGAVLDTLGHVRDVVARELNGVTDNPLVLPDGTVLHGGNFHGQPLAFAMDHLAVAAAEIALVSERRLARLLDPKTNDGLPPFLIGDAAGERSGLMGLQYCASSSVAENAVLAHPATLGSVPTNANNQDVVPMGTVGVRRTRRILENARRVVAIELLAAAEAVERCGADELAPGTRAVWRAVRRLADPVDRDRPLGADVEAVAGAIDRRGFAPGGPDAL